MGRPNSAIAESKVSGERGGWGHFDNKEKTMNQWIVKAGTWASKPLSITEAATLAEKLVNVSEFYCDVTIEFYGTPIAESATFTNAPSNGIKECLMCRDLHDRSGGYCTRCKRISVDEECARG